MKALNFIVYVMDKTINLIIYLMVILILFIAIYALTDSVETVNDAKIPKELKKYSPDEGTVDIKQMQEEFNEEIVGWIVLDGTSINYPIVQGKDNIKYLTYNFRNEYSSTGTIFLDYRNDRFFEDDYSIIYGHNLNSNVMLGELKNYKDENFFEEHLAGTLYTENKEYKLNVYAFSILDAYSNLYNINYFRNGKNKEVIDTIKSININENNNDYKKILVLSTCSSQKVNNRSVLIITLS